MLPNRLKSLRIEKGLNQEDLGKAIGFSSQAISSWENNYRGLGDDTIILLANFFNVSTDYLLGRSDNRNPSNGLYTKTITDEDGYSIEIKTEVPFSELSKEKQQDMIDVAMEKLFEVKKEKKKKK